MLDINKIVEDNLNINCEKCFGLCCTALYFSKLDGFPNDKEGGKPCINLQNDFKCKVHKSLSEKGLKGCIAYDCFGAGQKTAQVTYGGQSFIENSDSSKEMFDVFLIMRQLHEMMWYLIEAFKLEDNIKIQNDIEKKIQNILKYTEYDAAKILMLNLEEIRNEVNMILRNISEKTRKLALKNKKDSNVNSKKKIDGRKNYIGVNLKKYDLRGADLRGSLLIAADLSNSDLSYADFIGADVRDCNVRNSNLSKSIFLTQSQLNCMKGDKNTRIPQFLNIPSSWDK